MYIVWTLSTLSTWVYSAHFSASLLGEGGNVARVSTIFRFAVSKLLISKGFISLCEANHFTGLKQNKISVSMRIHTGVFTKCSSPLDSSCTCTAISPQRFKSSMLWHFPAKAYREKCAQQIPYCCKWPCTTFTGLLLRLQRVKHHKALLWSHTSVKDQQQLYPKQCRKINMKLNQTHKFLKRARYRHGFPKVNSFCTDAISKPIII